MIDDVNKFIIVLYFSYLFLLIDGLSLLGVNWLHGKKRLLEFRSFHPPSPHHTVTRTHTHTHTHTHIRMIKRWTFIDSATDSDRRMWLWCLQTIDYVWQQRSPGVELEPCPGRITNIAVKPDCRGYEIVQQKLKFLLTAETTFWC